MAHHAYLHGSTTNSLASSQSVHVLVAGKSGDGYVSPSSEGEPGALGRTWVELWMQTADTGDIGELLAQTRQVSEN